VSFNGETKRISVSKVSNLRDASVSYSDLQGWGARRDKFISLQDRIWRTRGMGDFWSHMLVAEGAVDISVEPVLNLWDMAALDVIVREAGGTFTNIEGKSGPHGASAISSNSLLHQEFIQALN
jgi:histidinol-phosphatase